MKGCRILSMMATGMLLSGCVSETTELPSYSSETVITSSNQSQIAFEYHNFKDTQLHVITRQDTSGTAAAKTVQLIAGMFVGSPGVTSFDKNDLNGQVLTTFPNPVKDYLNPKIADSLKKEMDKKEKRRYEGRIFIYSDKWRLIYKDLAGGDNKYQLKLNVTLIRLTVARKYELSCEANNLNSQEFTLAEWQANDYQKVKEVSHSIMDSCAQQFSTRAPEFLF